MKKRVMEETNWLAVILMSLVIFFIVNYLSFRHYHRFDTTKQGIFSISGKTKSLLKSLKSPLNITVFLTEDNPDVFKPVKELLNSYSSACKKITIEYIDPHRQVARTKELAQKYGVSSPDVVVFEYEGRNRYVETSEMVEYNERGAVKGLKAEESFTSAILSLSESKKPVIYFSTGHGEPSINDKSETGLSTICERLKKENLEVREFATIGRDIPSDSNCLIIAGPATSFTKPEADAISKYLNSGGHALILLDPNIEGGRIKMTGLEELLQSWGLPLDMDIVIDPAASIPFLGAETIYANNWCVPDFVSPLQKAKIPMQFTLARSLQIKQCSDKDYIAQCLLKTTDNGWGETNLAQLDHISKQPTDINGPVTIAGVAYSDKKGRDARLIFIGDSDCFINASVESQEGNKIFFIQAITFLLHRQSRIEIPPKTQNDVHLSISKTQLITLLVIIILVIPAVIAVIGIFVFVTRRR